MPNSLGQVVLFEESQSIVSLETIRRPTPERVALLLITLGKFDISVHQLKVTELLGGRRLQQIELGFTASAFDGFIYRSHH